MALKGEEIHMQDSGGKTCRKNTIYNIRHKCCDIIKMC